VRLDGKEEKEGSCEEEDHKEESKEEIKALPS
jgi:hypothetical protein